VTTRTRFVIGIVVVLVAAVAVVWSLFFALEADPEAAAIAASAGRECPDPCAFAFGSEQAPSGLILYPGAGVEPAAYAPLAVEIADSGFFVSIQQAPLGLAILDSDMAQVSLDSYPDIGTWAVGGHSLGGAMAARFASQSSEIDGLVLLAAYPESGLDLSDSGLEVISIYGDRDLLATPDDVLGARPQLPDDTEFVLIEGGNHAQFGSYGHQPRDGEAAIPASEQRNEIAGSVSSFLTDLETSRGGG
jgi:dienelactone hydrolase